MSIRLRKNISKLLLVTTIIASPLADAHSSEGYFDSFSEKVSCAVTSTYTWVKENPVKSALIAGFTGISLYGLYHGNPLTTQSGGKGEGLGYIVMLGDNMGVVGLPTTTYQKELFSQTLPGIIQSRLPDAKFCFVDGVNLDGWKNCYKNFESQGVTKVNNIVFAHGIAERGFFSQLWDKSKFITDLINSEKHFIGDTRNQIIFDKSLKDNLFNQYPNMSHELMLLSCFSGNIDTAVFDFPIFSLAKENTSAIGNFSTNWIEYLKYSSSPIPTTAQEFYHMHANYGASIGTTEYGDVYPYILKLLGKAPFSQTADAWYAVRTKTSDILYPFRDGVRALTQKFDSFMPFMPFYVDAKNNVMHGSKRPHYVGNDNVSNQQKSFMNLALDGLLRKPENYLIGKYIFKPMFDSFLHRYITGFLFLDVTLIDAAKDYVVLPIASNVKNLIVPSQVENDDSEKETIYQDNGVPEGFSW